MASRICAGARGYLDRQRVKIMRAGRRSAAAQRRAKSAEAPGVAGGMAGADAAGRPKTALVERTVSWEEAAPAGDTSGVGVLGAALLMLQKVRDGGSYDAPSRLAAMWWGHRLRKDLHAARARGVEGLFVQHLRAGLREAPGTMVAVEGGLSEMQVPNGRSAAAASRAALTDALRGEVPAWEASAREERRAAKWEALVATLTEELMHEVVTVETFRTAHHVHGAAGRAGFKDAMDWLDPKARAYTRPLFGST